MATRLPVFPFVRASHNATSALIESKRRAFQCVRFVSGLRNSYTALSGLKHCLKECMEQRTVVEAFLKISSRSSRLQERT